MKKFSYILLMLILQNCKTDKTDIYLEYNGDIVKVEVDYSKTDSTFTGYGAEYFPNGNVKSLSYFINGKSADTLFYYHENGLIKEKGLVKDNFYFDWWTYYDNNGKLTEKSEWIILRDSSYKNQSIYFDKKGKIKTNISTYFELDIPDTLKVGKNLGRVKKYVTNNYGNEGNLISVIMDNQYSKSKIQKDTFSDGTLKPFFGIYAYKTGKVKIKGRIQETILNINKQSDSLHVLSITTHYKYFEKVIYVWDKDKKSESAKRIGKQMEHL